MQWVVTNGDIALVVVAVQVVSSTATGAESGSVVQVDLAKGADVPRSLGHVPEFESQGTADWLFAPPGLLQIVSTQPGPVPGVVPVDPPQVAEATKAVWLFAPAGKVQTVS